MSPEEWEASQGSKGISPEEWDAKQSKTTPNSSGVDKGMKEAAAKGQVYVKPLTVMGHTFSPQTTAGLYNVAEAASSTVRGIGQILGINEEDTKEQVRTSQALMNNPEYKTAAITGKVAGTIADPTNFVPLGKVATLGEFALQSAKVGGVTSFLGATAEDGLKGRGELAAEGVVGGGAGGLILGSVIRTGGKMFGKDWLPWKATPEEKKLVRDEILKESPDTPVKEINHFLNAPEDRHINAKAKAEQLLSENASPKKVSAVVEKNPLVQHYIDEYAARYNSLKENITPEPTLNRPISKEEQAIQDTKAAQDAGDARTIPEVPETKPTYEELRKQQGGFASPQLLADVAGAGVGAVANPEDPLTGAVIGAGIAHGGGKLILKGASKFKENILTQEESKDVLKASRELIGDASNEIRSTQRNTYATYNKMVTEVPSPERRELITHSIENPKLSSELTKEERVIRDNLIKNYADLGKRAKEAGVVKELRENYINHVVKQGEDKTKTQETIDFFIGAGGDITSRGSTSSKFGKERTYDTIKDLEEAGFTLKTKDSAELFKIYADSVEKAIIGKNLVSTLSKESIGKDKFGRDITAIKKLGKDSSIPYGWVTNPQLRNYAIHPDLAPIVEHMFSSYSPSTIMKSMVAISNAVKRINVVASFFHSWNLFGSMVLSAPSIAAKEVFTGFRGVRAATTAFRRGGLGDTVDSAIKSGLVLETPIDVEKGIFGHIGAAVDDTSSKLGFSLNTEAGGKTLEKYTTNITDKVTWDYMHTGGKLLVYNHILESMKLKNPNADMNILGKEAARFVNNAFGGLNWTQIAAESNQKVVHELTNPKSRAVMALAMFAPDWTISTVRATVDGLIHKGNGFKGMINPKTSTDLSRQYILKTALAYFTLFNGINLALSNKPIWENKDPTRIEFQDGTSIQAAKHAMEPTEWVLHPEKTLANKMAFLPRAAITYWGEKEYAFGPDLKDKSIPNKMTTIGKMALPFQVSSAMNAPEGAGIERAVMGTIGIPEYGMTKEQRRQVQIDAKRERIKRKLSGRGY